jgi:steroid delta-isomerase-like uncharacterized protein
MPPRRGSTKSAEQAGAGEAMSIESLRDFSSRWLEAWNSHQADRILEFLTEDVEVRDDSWPKTMHGHADVREFLEALWRGIPDMSFELLDGPYVIPGEPRASLHWRASGTHTGPLDPPGFAPTGRRWEVDGADFQEFRDGRICRLRVEFDMMTVTRQLGLMPTPGSRGERAMTAAQRGVMRVLQEYQQRRA